MAVKTAVAEEFAAKPKGIGPVIRGEYVWCIRVALMAQVAARAGVYDILNHLGFSEFENPRDTPLARMRCRWQQQNIQTLPFRGKFI